MNSVSVHAPAKLNLGLRITGIRSDGFHSIESVFSTISLHDEISVSITPSSSRITIQCTGVQSPPDKSNLAWKAADMFRIAAGEACGVHIRLHKNIPSPGGLGGGSSDAAAVLKALEILTGWKGETKDIQEQLGSDVPFFGRGLRAALVKGRGEIIEECVLPDYHAVLVNSMENIPTKLAYALWDKRQHLTETGGMNHYTALNFGVWHEGKPFPVRLDNHFLPVLSRRFPGVERTARELAELCDNWGLSGSGPVFYALFPTEEEAVKAEKHLGGKFPWVFRCRSRQIGASSNG